MTRRFRSWVEGYLAAWESNDPERIAALFAPEARYHTAPFRKPWVGGEEIVTGWLGRGDRPGTWAFEFAIEDVIGATAYVRGRTVYLDPPIAYSNLWRVTLDHEGRCSEFVEWWMEERP